MALGLAVAEANGRRILAIGGQEIEDVAIGIAIHTHHMPISHNSLRVINTAVACRLDGGNHDNQL